MRNHQLLYALEQQFFEDVVEVVETHERVTTCVSKIGGVAFVFHADCTRDSEHFCVGIQH